jgi:hypothetical protein
MTAKSDFTPQEWDLVLEGPPSAGMIVITAQRGGTLRETVSMAKSYAEARAQHGQSELLDEIKAHMLEHLREAVALLEGKAQPQELDEYRSFVVNLAQRAAAAHREHGGGDPVSDVEHAAINEIAQAMGTEAAT